MMEITIVRLQIIAFSCITAINRPEWLNLLPKVSSPSYSVPHCVAEGRD
jgi:hypothetical protein